MFNDIRILNKSHVEDEGNKITMRLLLKYTGKDGELEPGFLGIGVSCVHMMCLQTQMPW